MMAKRVRRRRMQRASKRQLYATEVSAEVSATDSPPSGNGRADARAHMDAPGAPPRQPGRPQPLPHAGHQPR